MPCARCGTHENTMQYNYNENGFPTIRNGTDVCLCPPCWMKEMDNTGSNIIKEMR